MGSMPIVPDSFGSIVATLQAQLLRGSTAPAPDHSTIKNGSTTVLDGNNQPRVEMGLFTLPGGVHAGTSIYGVVAFDASGNPIVILGQQPDGSYGLGVYDASGNLQVELNAAGVTAGAVRLTSSGLQVFDGGGTVQVLAGLINFLPAIYGLAVRPFGGSQLQQVGGVLTVAPPNASNVTNTSWTAFGSPNTVTAEIGPSGQALVTVSAGIATGTAGEHGYIGVQVDSAAATDWLDLGSGGGATAGTISSEYPVSGLSPGSHTFKLYYQTANNGAANVSFTGVVMTVQPL